MTDQSHAHLNRRASDLLGVERFFELSSDLLCILDAQGNFLRLSDSWQPTLGVALGELQARPVTDWVHPDDLEATIAALAGNRRGERVSGFVNRFRTGSGGWCHLSWNSAPAETDGLIFAVARVVSDRVREREAFYHAAIEATNDGFWLADPQGRIVDANSAYARMSGYSLDELRAMGIADVEVMEDEADVAARMAAIRASGTSIFETRHRRKDGSVWDVEVTVLFSDIDGGRCFAFLRDLRRRRRAETLLKARLHLSDVGRSGDIDRLMTEVLDAAERLTGSSIGFFHFVDPGQSTLSLHAWSTNTLARMCTAEGKGAHYPVAEAGLWADCLRTGEPLVCNDYGAAPNRRGMPDGHAVVSRLLSVPIPGRQGFVAVIGVGNKTEDYVPDDIDLVRELATIAMDIVNWLRAQSDQRALSDALAATAREWSAAMDSFQGGVAILDAKRRLIRANQAFFALTASQPDDRLGKHVHCLQDVGESIADCPLCDALSKDQPWHATLEADDPANPSGRPLEVRLAPIADETGAARSLLLSLYDLSETREREIQMARTIDQLTDSNAELERFAQVAAHDLQEPARRQVLYSQLLLRLLQGQLDEEKQRYFGYIMDGALRMRDMVRELHTYADAGRLPQADEAVDLDQVLADVLSALDHDIDESGAQVSVVGLGRVAGRRPRLHLLLLNLLSNALKFHRPGTPPCITVSALDHDGWLEVAIADNGIGIPREHRANLFGLFRRVHAVGDRPGMGMGLAQCRRIVEALGGRIWIDDGCVQGTIVRFTLPRAQV
ncbi:Putative Histidine kinase (fragment) [Magnetospirillum sp. LM-5]|uniref:PAS domain S-box protein n=1 Tax=Magnetospirillum sp. LM-5 TaxID=2681466 RepID=UPI001386232E